MTLPEAVKNWAREVFARCNSTVTSKLSNQPNVHEEHLDHSFIESLSNHESPRLLENGWVVRVDTHFLGGLRHFDKWEIADIGILVLVKSGGRALLRKAAVLQSKRLYPTNGRVRNYHPIDFEIGIARLADPEDLSVTMLDPVDYKFESTSTYAAVRSDSDQVRAIDEYMQHAHVPVYYQLYNPWDIPWMMSLPSTGPRLPEASPQVGAKITPASELHRLLARSEGHTTPTFSDCATLTTWRLEDFVADELLACREGHLYTDPDDTAIRRLFFRRSGPIAAAIAMTFEAPTAAGFDGEL